MNKEGYVRIAVTRKKTHNGEEHEKELAYIQMHARREQLGHMQGPPCSTHYLVTTKARSAMCNLPDTLTFAINL